MESRFIHTDQEENIITTWRVELLGTSIERVKGLITNNSFLKELEFKDFPIKKENMER